MSRCLIVYYSRTGNTREVAEELALRSGWDLAEIRDAQPRVGAWGIIRSVLEAVLGHCPAIHYRGPHPRQYGLVIVATPNWCGRIASPMRSFVKEYGDWFGRVGIVVTTGGVPAGEQVPDHLADLLGWTLAGTLVVPNAEMDSEKYRDRMMTFIEQLAPPPPLRELIPERIEAGVHA